MTPLLDWTGWSAARIDGYGATWREVAARTLVLRGRGAAMRAPLRRSALTAKFAWRGAERYVIDGHTAAADDATWLAIDAGELYASSIAPGPPVHTLALFFDDALVDSVRRQRRTDELEPHAVVLSEPLRLGRRALPLDRDLTAALAAAGDPLARDALLHLALGRILDAAADAARERARLPCVRAATRAELHRRLARAHDLLMSAYASPLDLGALAAAAAMAPHHFLRRFRDAYGTTPHRALVTRRLERARHLLATTRTPIAAIAAAVGFDSAAAFATRFRRETGLSPRAYRMERRPSDQQHAE